MIVSGLYIARLAFRLRRAADFCKRLLRRVSAAIVLGGFFGCLIFASYPAAMVEAFYSHGVFRLERRSRNPSCTSDVVIDCLSLIRNTPINGNPAARTPYVPDVYFSAKPR